MADTNAPALLMQAQQLTETCIALDLFVTTRSFVSTWCNPGIPTHSETALTAIQQLF